MKVLIFENEYNYIKTYFDYVNDIYFENSIEYTILEKSQDLSPFSDIINFDIVFIDISLAKKSELDGFGILSRIKNLKLSVKKIIILTGNHLIREKLEERQLPITYKILTKPISIKELLAIMKNN